MARSDAVRNRARVLDAARELITRDGVEVRMDAIAAQAGVAVGTLYRHFSTKEALVAAVVDDSLEALARRSEASWDAVGQGADAWAELQELIRWFAAAYARDRAFKTTAATLGAEVHADDGAGAKALARALVAVDGLLAQARASGAVRDDVTADDLAVVLTQVPDEGVAGPGSLERYLRVVLRGLAARGEVT